MTHSTFNSKMLYVNIEKVHLLSFNKGLDNERKLIFNFYHFVGLHSPELIKNDSSDRGEINSSVFLTKIIKYSFEKQNSTIYLL